MICTPEAGGEAGSGRRIAVVGSHAHSVQQAWKKREALLPSRLKAGDVSMGPVHQFSDTGRSSRRRGEWHGHRVNRTSQVLVKDPSLDQSQGLKVMLGEQIEVLRSRRLQVGISLGKFWSAGWIIHEERGDISKVGAGDAHTVGRAQNRIRSYSILGLHAGKRVDIAVAGP